jgi:hypothetical protein
LMALFGALALLPFHVEANTPAAVAAAAPEVSCGL